LHRRQFINASAAASALALTGQSPAQTASSRPREFYQLRQYHLRSGIQPKQCESYFSGALIPALNRLGCNPVGAFRIDIGPETPTFYLLIPNTSAEVLATLDLRLGADDAFLKAAEPFWNAPAATPAFERVSSELLAAFEGWPKITPPDTHAKRLFQLRTYESSSDHDHVRKVEMFHKGEFDIFQKAGFHQVFYGDVLIGPRLPKLTYMLSFPDLATMTQQWSAFGSDPDWKKLSTSPRYAYAEIVSNITNLILSPLTCSQI
jgi:hypothetical protein